MKKFLLVLFTCGLLFNSYAQSDEVLMTIGDQDITKGEFEYLFYKNNDKEDITYKDVKDYLDLFVKFKLKVIEAENRGMDQKEDFIKELGGYRAQLAKPYLTDRSVDEFYIKQAYDRLNEEVEASHILIEVKNGKTPADTLEAYNKALDIIDQLKNGADFAELARKYSADPSAQQNGGYLGYFKGFQMIYPFEDAAYKTPVGEISQPVRTTYGYHIIKVLDKRPSPGEVLVEHIMKVARDDDPADVKAQKKEEIDKIYQQLLDGKNFEDLAKKNSDDYSTASNGGRLNWFSTGQLVKPFETAAFALEKPGDISEPIRTQFGWHIIKLIDKRDVQPFNEIKDKISARLLKDDRGNKAHESFINKLKNEYNIEQYNVNIEPFAELSHKYAYTDSLFKADTRNMNKPVLKIEDSVYTQKDFADYLIANPRGENPGVADRVRMKWSAFKDQKLVDYEDSQLERKYPEFRYLMKEYHDGILLFDISSQEVWDKASQDTTGLEKFYAKHKKDYKWDEPHFSGNIIYCQTDTVMDSVKLLLAENMPIRDVFKKLNTTKLNFKYDTGSFTKGQNKIVDQMIWDGEVVEPDKKFPVVFLDGQTYPEGEVKKLNECRGAVTSDYQNELEDKWVKALKKKYKVKVNKSVLKEVAGDK
ncbi:peptidylprolyl isomerase [Saccharicrinis sp. FJH54]|uniref:foldase protein PrsA n=1 Tax=Saccharicrinis sp. FJH54 TaxID=3344665 RepID=UPI0035D4F53D